MSRVWDRVQEDTQDGPVKKLKVLKLKPETLPIVSPLLQEHLE